MHMGGGGGGGRGGEYKIVECSMGGWGGVRDWSMYDGLLAEVFRAVEYTMGR